MSQYPGAQPPQPPPSDPYYGQPAGDPYAQPQADPYYGQPPGDPYAQPPAGDPYYGQPPGDPYGQQAQQQAYQAYWAQQAQYGYPPGAEPRSRGGMGAVIVGVFLVLLGIWFLFRDEVALDIGGLWAPIAVGLGVLMVIAAFTPRRRI